jgi:UDP-glucose 4-epimerase
MNILITGGAGFIGSHLAEHHLAKGDTVMAVDDLSTGSMEVFAGFDRSQLHFEKADILDWDGLEQAVDQADRIYHMAAVVGMFRVLKEPVEVTRVNVLGTERLLECVARRNHLPELVVTSSSSVYGHAHAEVLVEGTDLVYAPEKGGLTAYALSKLMNEVQAMAYRQIHGLPVTIPRLFNAVGPRQSGNYGFVLPRFIKQALEGIPLTVYGDGTQTRSFCDVRDTVAALDMLAEKPEAWGLPVNVGNPREISILDLARMVIERSGSSSRIEFVPFEQGYGSRFWQITQRRPSVDLLQQLTPFRHAWTLEMTIDDLISRNRTALVPEGRLL